MTDGRWKSLTFSERECPVAVTEEDGSVLFVNEKMVGALANYRYDNFSQLPLAGGLSFPLAQCCQVALLIPPDPTSKLLDPATSSDESFYSIVAGRVISSSEGTGTPIFTILPVEGGFAWFLVSGPPHDTFVVRSDQASEKKDPADTRSFFEALARSDSAAVAVLTPSGKLLSASQPFRDLFGLVGAGKIQSFGEIVERLPAAGQIKKALINSLAEAQAYVQQDGEISLEVGGKTTRYFYTLRPLVIESEVKYIIFSADEVPPNRLAVSSRDHFHQDPDYSAPDVLTWIWACDDDLVITCLTEGWYRLTGFSPDSMTGYKATAGGFLCGFFDQGLNEPILAAMQQRRPFINHDVSVVTPNGTKWIRISGHPVYDPEGRFQGYKGGGSDITHLVSVQARLNRLQERNQLLLSIIEMMPIGLILHDAEQPRRPITYANDAFCAMSGYAPEEVIGQPYDFLLRPPRSDDTRDEEVQEDNLIEEAWRRLEEGEGVEFEEVCYRRTGEEMICKLSLLPVSDGSDKIIAYARIMSDVTEERERERRHIESQKLLALGELSHGLAHEINNLLQPVISLPEFIKEAIPANRQSALDDLEVLAVSGRKIREIVRNVMRFSDREEESTEKLILNEVLAASCDFIKRLLPDTVRVERVMPEEEIRVAADRTSFVQVVANLCINASQAMGGYGTISVELGRVQLTSPPRKIYPERNSFRPGIYACVSVADKGIGIKPEDMNRIFDPFYTSKSTGTGLGLAVVRQIVTQWGGFIVVHSVETKGTRVSVYVPMLLDTSSP